MPRQQRPGPGGLCWTVNSSLSFEIKALKSLQWIWKKRWNVKCIRGKKLNRGPFARKMKCQGNQFKLYLPQLHVDCEVASLLLDSKSFLTNSKYKAYCYDFHFPIKWKLLRFLQSKMKRQHVPWSLVHKKRICLQQTAKVGHKSFFWWIIYWRSEQTWFKDCMYNVL